MASKKYHYSKWFNKLLKATFGAYLLKRFHVEIFNEKIRDLKPPYLIIGNHVGAWDPFLMSMGIEEPVYFVISDAHFRHFWLRQILRLVGGIPKSKQLADSGTIRGILSVKKENGVIGLYPEGARNWDLKNIPVFYATAKLVKSLNIPVVTTVMEGAGLTRPRWARSSRNGIIHLRYDILMTPDQIGEMSLDEINQKIIDGIHFNEYDWQEKNMIPYKGTNLAEFLDMFLIVCPRCKSICSMHSRENTLSCTKCGYAVDYNEYGYLTTDAEPFFNSPQTWSEWQNTWLLDFIRQEEYVSGKKPLFSDTNAKLFTGERRGKLRQHSQLWNIALYFDKIEFSRNGKVHSFSLDKASGFNVQNNNKFEFYYENKLYRFKFTTQHKSVYKYELALNLIHRLKDTSLSKADGADR